MEGQPDEPKVDKGVEEKDANAEERPKMGFAEEDTPSVEQRPEEAERQESTQQPVELTQSLDDSDVIKE
ncbi:unnamed protein product [Lasius platythorax]|uniref:Uncharacterized protein n=1 Tax=Lasius platythorax TaxID=488582 RepID=A0AAV2MZB8_9HYME